MKIHTDSSLEFLDENCPRIRKFMCRLFFPSRVFAIEQKQTTVVRANEKKLGFIVHVAAHEVKH